MLFLSFSYFKKHPNKLLAIVWFKTSHDLLFHKRINWDGEMEVYIEVLWITKILLAITWICSLNALIDLTLCQPSIFNLICLRKFDLKPFRTLCSKKRINWAREKEVYIDILWITKMLLAIDVEMSKYFTLIW